MITSLSAMAYQSDSLDDCLYGVVAAEFSTLGQGARACFLGRREVDKTACFMA